MNWHRHRPIQNGGSAPATPGFNAVAPEWLFSYYGAAVAAPVIPAAESTLGSHPCVALSSAQVLPEWITSTPLVNAFAANGDNPLNFVSHSRGSLQGGPPAPCAIERRQCGNDVWFGHSTGYGTKFGHGRLQGVGEGDT